MTGHDRRSAGFTLVELLVVVGIIGLLIGILLPSMKGARQSAQKAKVQVQLENIAKCLELFHNDAGDYPESAKREDPTDDSSANAPSGAVRNDTTLYGAQALARAMVGKDLKGYVDSRRARKHRLNQNPNWYYDIPDADYRSDYPRQEVYIKEPTYFARTATRNDEARLGGIKPDSINIDENTQWVIADTFSRPVLYYKANPRGNVLCGPQQAGGGADTFPEYDPDFIPFYSLLDNDVFTGNFTSVPAGGSEEPGWRFGTAVHQIGWLGNPFEPHDLTDAPNVIGSQPPMTMPFARYIHDHQAEAAAAVDSDTPTLRPMNPDTYLLITAGPDGIFGTSDDINNFEKKN